MTYKCSRETKLLGDAPSWNFTVHARHDDRQACWICEQAEGLSKPGGLVWLQVGVLHNKHLNDYLNVFKG